MADVIKLVGSRRGELNHKILTVFAKRAYRSFSTKEKNNDSLALGLMEMLQSLAVEDRSI